MPAVTDSFDSVSRNSHFAKVRRTVRQTEARSPLNGWMHPSPEAGRGEVLHALVQHAGGSPDHRG
jgi:hypothetical protein